MHGSLQSCGAYRIWRTALHTFAVRSTRGNSADKPSLVRLPNPPPPYQLTTARPLSIQNSQNPPQRSHLVASHYTAPYCVMCSCVSCVHASDVPRCRSSDCKAELGYERASICSPVSNFITAGADHLNIAPNFSRYWDDSIAPKQIKPPPSTKNNSTPHNGPAPLLLRVVPHQA